MPLKAVNCIINIDSVFHIHTVVQVHCYTVKLYSAVSPSSFNMCLSQIDDRSASELTWLLSIHPSGHQSSAGITQKQPFTLTFTPTPTLESPFNWTTNMWFGLWEKAKVPRENQFKHSENMNSTQKSPRRPVLNAGCFFLCCDWTELTTAPLCSTTNSRCGLHFERRPLIEECLWNENKLRLKGNLRFHFPRFNFGISSPQPLSSIKRLKANRIKSNF